MIFLYSSNSWFMIAALEIEWRIRKDFEWVRLAAIPGCNFIKNVKRVNFGMKNNNSSYSNVNANTVVVRTLWVRPFEAGIKSCTTFFKMVCVVLLFRLLVQQWDRGVFEQFVELIEYTHIHTYSKLKIIWILFILFARN